MKELILGKVQDAGLAFAVYDREEDEELDKETLRDALMTGHVTPDELGEVFVRSVLKNLDLWNNLHQRREDKIEAVRSEMVRSFEEGLLEGRASKKDIRAIAERLVDALFGKAAAVEEVAEELVQEEVFAKSAFKVGDLVEVVHPIFSGLGKITEHGWLENIHWKKGEPSHYLVWIISPEAEGSAWPGILDIIDPMYGLEGPKKSMKQRAP